ncbi:hypothetical protein [Marisediminicola sp. LYQ134]|uniref:hypothetical protein n=1 Tax=Marisediminicola sp. LYQ134 TaxID=3391061 RepID=UPI0039831473
MSARKDQPTVATVLTSSGTTYVVDTERMTLTRMRATSPPSNGVEASELRRDGGRIKIQEIVALELGKRGIFVLEPLGHPELTFATLRSTTPIVSIEWNTTEQRLEG